MSSIPNMPEIPEVPRMSNLEGAILSEYFLQQRISTGGVADVYRAIQQGEEQHDVAVKIYRSSHAQRASFRDYFMNEAEKIGQFEHPNILPILEFGEGEDLLYLVMPYIATGTLDDLLKRVGGRFSASQALPVMQHLSAALQYAHQHHVIHGNLKLSNVFVAADGRILLADFGIARGYGGYDESQQSLTRVGWGSAEYVAPEVSLGVLKRSSDMYSLGALLFRMLAGQPPFSGHTPVEVLLKHVRQAPPYARAFVPTISDAVDAVLQKALQKRPEDRFASVEEFNNAFSAAVAVAPVAPIASPFAPSLLKSPAPFNSSASFAVTPTPIDPATPLPVGIFGQGAQDNPFLPLPSLPSLTPPVLSTPTAVPFVMQAQEMMPQNPQQPQRSQNQPRVTRQLSPAMPFDVEMPATGPDVGAEQVKTAQRADGSRQSGFEPGVVIGKQHFWSAEPVEWSPIGSSPGSPPLTPLTHNIPLNAADYLAGASNATGTQTTRRATAVLAPEPSPEAARVAMPQADGDDPEYALENDESAFALLLRKWLPVIVVVLLLLGLLGAFLSSFFFPMS